MATEIKPKRKPRTVKEKKFAKEYIANGGIATKAALVAYDTTNYASANVIGQENLQKLSFDDYFAAAGLTDAAIAANLTEAAKAEDDVLRENGWTKKPDWTTRLKAHDLAIKIMGKYAPEKRDLTSLGEKITIPILGGDTAVYPDNRNQ